MFPISHLYQFSFPKSPQINLPAGHSLSPDAECLHPAEEMGYSGQARLGIQTWDMERTQGRQVPAGNQQQELREEEKDSLGPGSTRHMVQGRGKSWELQESQREVRGQSGEPERRAPYGIPTKSSGSLHNSKMLGVVGPGGNWAVAEPCTGVDVTGNETRQPDTEGTPRLPHPRLHWAVETGWRRGEGENITRNVKRGEPQFMPELHKYLWDFGTKVCLQKQICALSLPSKKLKTSAKDDQTPGHRISGTVAGYWGYWWQGGHLGTF